MMNALFWTCWLINAAFAYGRVRSEERKGNGKWTRFDRFFWLPICLMCGTFLLLVFLIVDLVIAIGNTNWAKREARW